MSGIMEKLRLWIRAFFGFSRIETNGFLVLLPLLVVILFSLPIYRWWKHQHNSDYSQDEKSLDSLVSSLQWDDNVVDSQEHTDISFFPFDPNTISKTELIDFGMDSYVAERMINFRNKGYVFKNKEDILKIYGIDSSWFNKAKPWIKIQNKEKPNIPVSAQIVEKKGVVAHVAQDINTVDTTQLKNVYGIGSILAKRILQFRDRLGGFISENQFEEVYGLDSAVVNRLKTEFYISKEFSPRKININTVTAKELSKHPYINLKQSELILNYRFQHGDFTSADQLHNIIKLNKETIEKIKPYITLN